MSYGANLALSQLEECLQLTNPLQPTALYLRVLCESYNERYPQEHCLSDIGAPVTTERSQVNCLQRS
jgi:hypothetical protein